MTDDTFTDADLAAAQAKMEAWGWTPIAAYAGQRFVLLNDGDRQHFGYGADGKWFEIVDGQSIELETFEPVEFAIVPEDEIEAYT